MKTAILARGNTMSARRFIVGDGLCMDQVAQTSSIDQPAHTHLRRRAGCSVRLHDSARGRAGRPGLVARRHEATLSQATRHRACFPRVTTRRWPRESPCVPLACASEACRPRRAAPPDCSRCLPTDRPHLEMSGQDGGIQCVAVRQPECFDIHGSERCLLHAAASRVRGCGSVGSSSALELTMPLDEFTRGSIVATPLTITKPRPCSSTQRRIACSSLSSVSFDPSLLSLPNTCFRCAP